MSLASLIETIDELSEEKRLLNEATFLSVSKEAFTAMRNVLSSLSDALAMMNKKGTVAGGGNVAGFLREAELSINVMKTKVKVVNKDKAPQKFNKDVKKVIGELELALERVVDRIDSSIIPSLEDVGPSTPEIGEDDGTDFENQKDADSDVTVDDDVPEPEPTPIVKPRKGKKL